MLSKSARSAATLARYGQRSPPGAQTHSDQGRDRGACDLCVFVLVLRKYRVQCAGFTGEGKSSGHQGKLFLSGSRGADNDTEIREWRAAVPSGTGVFPERAPFVAVDCVKLLVRYTEDWLEPVYDTLHRMLCQHQVLHADESVLQVLHEPGKTACGCIEQTVRHRTKAGGLQTRRTP